MKFFQKKNIEKSDEELMLLVQKGKQEALALLYDKYSAMMVNFFYRMLNRDMEKAQDFTQDLFLKLIDNADQFDSKRKFNTWIFTIAYNQCKNEYRRQSVRDSYLNTLSVKESDYVYQPKNSHDLNVFELTMNEVLATMDEKHAGVFLMRFQQGLSIKEIATILDCPEGTIKSRLFKATHDLSGALKMFDPRNK